MPFNQQEYDSNFLMRVIKKYKVLKKMETFWISFKKCFVFNQNSKLLDIAACP
jgi:hypothetical protein